MKSFGLGKKQTRGEQPKLTRPPSNADLTQLLATSQKAPDKPFNLTWQTPDSELLYTLSVVNSHGGAGRGGGDSRRAWNASAMDSGAIGDADWKMYKEIDGNKVEVFTMKTSDAFLIQNLIEEALMAGPVGSLSEKDQPVEPEQTPEPRMRGPAAPGSQYAALNPNAVQTAPPQAEEGNLRNTSVRTLMESYNSKRTTGRLICDLATVQAEVFFTNGEPVHAKSCHSIYQDRDLVGDAVIIDLLTWTEGNYKFQNGWPAASQSVTKPLHIFLGASAPVTSAEAAGYTPPSLNSNSVSADNDDFSNVDRLLGETFQNLVEISGLLKYGMFLMLTRSEFVRFEGGKHPFCIAAISVESPDNQLSNEVLGKIGECFESSCQPLDTIAYAGGSRFYALFPQSTGSVVSAELKQFLNNLASTALSDNLHGNAVKACIGLAEVPRDGVEFQEILDHACKLRRAATPERRMVMSA